MYCYTKRWNTLAQELAVADWVSTSYTRLQECRLTHKLVGHQEDSMAEKSKQPKEPKKKPQKTLMEKRKEKREKEASKHEE